MTLKTKASKASPAAATDLDVARRVLRLEIEGLKALSDQLDASFAAAVDALAAVTGRVVVSGMGKSGHIARKIAATLASTGTPAVFVHPAEASHGDLGMIAAGDAVICLSNSGDTPELSDLVAYTRRFGIPLIAIAGKAESALSQAADHTLLLPNTPEACPLGMAPTTSTTVMLALGDALALALLERNGFSANQFQVLHPGGSLGRMLVKVSDIMHTGEMVPLVARGTKMADALLVMTAKTFGCVGVMEANGQLAGIITDGDLRRHMTPKLLGLAVEEVMTLRPKTIRPSALAAEALHVMNAGSPQITSLFVTEGGRPAGIVHIHDCLRAGVA
ncbi:MAG TPA: KpsF/GutQ family sugar-phosphate isomerase [Candidatus Cybelea sp.]|nr:KpsF/GutQ family sugar-phosphate isomerase [Candidatus Cybelea sp.]